MYRHLLYSFLCPKISLFMAMFTIYHSRKHMHAIPEAGRHPAQTRKGHHSVYYHTVRL